ncbi:hypothetical protein [Vibrio fluvialis]|uniref:hypothetical protein n=1 Tax=Vibrio fluvialis TaxID=676 RepID=UPI001C9D42AA|nr:hypothetical protein [Vibrio fluvialis]MBY8211689.1 hypothetical protein [Vibrio fluvialis]MCG6363876.1 hypothetical protein [Vibrio fluvialis]
MATKIQAVKQDYPILKPLRLNGRWWTPEQDKTISLLPNQASMLLLNGKIGKPTTTAVSMATATKKEG